jgi:putative membrane protein
MPDNINRARDHLANERTFLAWIRTGVATIVFGFAVGRFSIALQELLQFEKKPGTTPGLTAWLGMISIVAGVLLILAGLFRYRKTRVQIDTDSFEPAGTIIDLVAVLLALFGVVLAGYLVWIKLAQG